MAFFQHANAQEKEREFQNQGEYEDYLAEKLFKENRKEEHFEKFKGKISVIDIEDDETYTIRFDTVTLTVSASEEGQPFALQLFKNGLFYPQLLSNQKTVEIDLFEEMTALSSITIKRFCFWYFRKKGNPSVYLLEVENKTATEKTSSKAFYKGAKLTLFKYGWMTI